MLNKATKPNTMHSVALSAFIFLSLITHESIAVSPSPNKPTANRQPNKPTAPQAASAPLPPPPSPAPARVSSKVATLISLGEDLKNFRDFTEYFYTIHDIATLQSINTNFIVPFLSIRLNTFFSEEGAIEFLKDFETEDMARQILLLKAELLIYTGHREEAKKTLTVLRNFYANALTNEMSWDLQKNTIGNVIAHIEELP